MRLALRVVLVLAVFLGVGYLAMHVLIARAVAHGTPEYDVRLAGAMGGLFAGGIAATMLTLLFAFGGRTPARSDDEL